jgi:hypothetical protein
MTEARNVMVPSCGGRSVRGQPTSTAVSRSDSAIPAGCRCLSVVWIGSVARLARHRPCSIRCVSLRRIVASTRDGRTHAHTYPRARLACSACAPDRTARAVQAARSPEAALAYDGDSDGDGDEPEVVPPECQVPAARAERTPRSPRARMGCRMHGAHLAQRGTARTGGAGRHARAERPPRSPCLWMGGTHARAAAQVVECESEHKPVEVRQTTHASIGAPRQCFEDGNGQSFAVRVSRVFVWSDRRALYFDLSVDGSSKRLTTNQVEDGVSLESSHDLVSAFLRSFFNEKIYTRKTWQEVSVAEWARQKLASQDKVPARRDKYKARSHARVFVRVPGRASASSAACGAVTD